MAGRIFYAPQPPAAPPVTGAGRSPPQKAACTHPQVLERGVPRRGWGEVNLTADFSPTTPRMLGSALLTAVGSFAAANSSQSTSPMAHMLGAERRFPLKLMPSSTSGAMYRRVPTQVRGQGRGCGHRACTDALTGHGATARVRARKSSTMTAVPASHGGKGREAYKGHDVMTTVKYHPDSSNLPQNCCPNPSAPQGAPQIMCILLRLTSKTEGRE